VIGKVKNWACSLARGQILVELDHDDELTDHALDCVVKGFRQFPEAGFLYTDDAEIFEDHTSYTYRDGWAFGYGSYRDVEYRGRIYKSGSAGNINSKTIRHIASTPTISGRGASLCTMPSEDTTSNCTWRTTTRSWSGHSSKPGW